jgi:hypothetical protein
MPIVQITGPISQPIVLDRGYSVSITPLAGSCRVQIPGEGVSDALAAASSYGPYLARREVVTSGGAGAGATVSISGDDEGGTITLKTGTGAFAGGLFVVTMGRETAGVSAIALTPRNSAAAACNLYVQGKSATTWQCAPVTAPASSSTLIWDYRAFF